MRLLSDLRYSLRTLSKSPGFALICVLILALGIGANAAIFSVVHAVILKRLPYADPERLVFVWERFPNMPVPPGDTINPARLNFIEWKRQNQCFSGIAALKEMTLTETGIPAAAHVSTLAVSVELPSVLGIRPQLGRLFAPDEEQRGRDLVAVLSDRYFERRFGRDRGCIGKTIVLDGTGFTVIGVLPRQFHLPATGGGDSQLRPDVWVPLTRLGDKPGDDQRRELFVMARLRAGVTVERARVEMSGIGARLAQAHPKVNEGWTTNVTTLAQEDTAPELRRALWVLLVSVAFVLLIACANLANLTLARASRRTRDFGVRIALGAARGHVIRQLLTESMLLAAAGCGFGMLLANWGLKLILAFRPTEMPHEEFIRLNSPVFAFAAGLALATTLLVGLAPALAASRTDVLSALKVGGAAGLPETHRRKREFLVAAEVALALVLLAGATFLIRSFYLVLTAELGFQADHLLTLDVDLPAKTYKDDAARARLNRQLLERVRALPGVVVTAVSDALPMHRISIATFHIVGRPEPKPDSAPLADYAHISPGYFGAMGIRLKAGRFFTDADLSSDPKRAGSVIINEAIANRFWPGENPLGQRIVAGGPHESYEIVGIILDHHQFGADRDARPEIFWPGISMASTIVVVRTHSDPASLAPTVEREIRNLDRDLPISNVGSMKHRIDEWVAPRRFMAVLLGIFAALALVLAGTGIYGVLATVVSSRTHEIGIRMALGAARSDVLALVFRQSLIPVAAGIGAGLAGTIVLSRYLESLLFGVHARDPLLIALVSAAIGAVAVAATWFPARRATRLDPNIALREE